MRPILALPLTAVLLGGCTVYGDTFAYRGPIVDVSEEDRASFCERYADETAANAYENYVDYGEGGSLITYRQAQRTGERAYQRCLAGRTG